MMTDFRLCPKCRAEQQGEQPEQEEGKMADKKSNKRQQNPQPHLPGMAPKRDNVIHKAAEKFADARAHKSEALRSQNEAEQELIDKMEKKGWKSYKFDNVTVELDDSPRVKCRIQDPNKEGPDDDEQ